MFTVFNALKNLWNNVTKSFRKKNINKKNQPAENLDFFLTYKKTIILNSIKVSRRLFIGKQVVYFRFLSNNCSFSFEKSYVHSRYLFRCFQYNRLVIIYSNGGC